jgi:alkanesulfonate monooxygenase SsuD/methylene tetrahydromethanopterin reductase-like flavin-dependent oxidoreductase (luciferase family)
MRYGINLPNGGLTGELLPKPVPVPRIPVWIGGGFPLKGATQRALHWDGSCLYLDTRGGPWRDWSPDDVRKLRTMVEQQRGKDSPFDIVLGGRQREADLDRERALINSLAAAGATWWIEYLPPELGGLDVIREAIARGPLRID